MFKRNKHTYRQIPEHTIKGAELTNGPVVEQISWTHHHTLVIVQVWQRAVNHIRDLKTLDL